ncbi:hypothetical protein [Tropicimonas isoalkanivorans]|uniref:DUF3329 domain-containing protein n=1 Tax=Tropicimonas isoalkanivorans TaxID=441112 RepID=A0A1I1DCH7_9RHOB|nr:hypothetical protein [Tropicimonas isoalkanivorans]SFB70798.1 hypothetical protein SAMN04488094_10141 [Tropicimonas isoalkanivorans]
MKLLDRNDPFFAPLWRRVVIVAVTLAWSVFEFVAGSPFWGILVGAIGIYCVYQLFVVFEPREPGDSDPS